MDENKFPCLFDDWELILHKDKDFKIIKMEGNQITINALNPYAFNIRMIMGKIIGSITSSECKLELYIHFNKQELIVDDWFNIDLLMEGSKIKYCGQIIVKRDFLIEKRGKIN